MKTSGRLVARLNMDSSPPAQPGGAIAECSINHMPTPGPALLGSLSTERQSTGGCRDDERTSQQNDRVS